MVADLAPRRRLLRTCLPPNYRGMPTRPIMMIRWSLAWQWPKLYPEPKADAPQDRPSWIGSPRARAYVLLARSRDQPAECFSLRARCLVVGLCLRGAERHRHAGRSKLWRDGQGEVTSGFRAWHARPRALVLSPRMLCFASWPWPACGGCGAPAARSRSGVVGMDGVCADRRGRPAWRWINPVPVALATRARTTTTLTPEEESSSLASSPDAWWWLHIGAYLANASRGFVTTRTTHVAHASLGARFDLLTCHLTKTHTLGNELVVRVNLIRLEPDPTRRAAANHRLRSACLSLTDGCKQEDRRVARPIDVHRRVLIKSVAPGEGN
nr:unnamed protein product [Digitaria exilis]